MKRLLLLLTILVPILSLTAEVDYHPQLIVAELLTASWSEEAGATYNGISEVMNHYHYGEVIPVRYYTSQNGGLYSSPSVDALIEEYTPTEYPTLIVNGSNRISGTSVPVENGIPYRSLIEKDYYNAVPLKMELNEFNTSTGYAEVLITLLSSSLQNATARFILIEDEVSGNITNLARVIEEVTFSLSGENSDVTLNTSLLIEPSWNADNLQLLVYVRNNSGKIIQAVSSYPTPDNYLRAAIPNNRMDIGPATGLYEVEYFGLFNFGNGTGFSINAMIDSAPEDWFLTYCDDEGVCYFGPLDFSLTGGDNTTFHANIVPASTGMMDYHFRVSGENLSEDYLIPFRYITDDVDYLIIDGDGWADYEEYTTAVLDANQYSYGIWHIGYSDVKPVISQNYHTLIWITGEREPALNLIEMEFLIDHLAAGKDLFISGQNIGKDLVLNQLYFFPDFYYYQLNAELISESTDLREITGLAGDYVGDGLNFFITGGDGANNQLEPEVISLAGQYGAEFLHYEDYGIAGIRSVLTNSNAKVIYLAFGFEAIDNMQARNSLLTNALNWLDATSVDEEVTHPANQELRLLPSYPNPFILGDSSVGSRNKQVVTIPYLIPAEKLADDAAITIYNIRGQRIKTLTDIRLMDREYGQIIWDGRDEHSKQVVSGVYFYILSNGGESFVRKMLIVK